jgi:hypothetical protein
MYTFGNYLSRKEIYVSLCNGFRNFLQPTIFKGKKKNDAKLKAGKAPKQTS